MRTILNFYPYKIPAVQQLKLHDPDIRKAFSLEFFARMVADDSLPWSILWTDEAHFPLNRKQPVCLEETIFMDDGAPPHNASSVQQLLRQASTDVRVNSSSLPTA
ncbi:hypothetical protein TNCV_1241631 [Trichonephila clavipes]|nr:hypothetical protein TNCV_1241631 [Trichonephila clavipes]